MKLTRSVTVIITTFNSGQYVLETLESVFSQTYQEIDLVISDDCSADNTVGLVNDWISLERVQKRFGSIIVITVPKNTGVSSNCNRSLGATKSEYFKFIAGDDILLPNCIEDNIYFVQQNPEAKIIFSQVKLYQDQFVEEKYIGTTPKDFPTILMDLSLDAQDQYKLLLLSDRIHYTPSFFANKQSILEVGGYDETNKLVEDYPMWLKLTKAGVRLHYFHKATVCYRIHAKATNNVGDKVLFKPSIFNSFKIRRQLAHPSLPWEIVASEYQTYLVSWFFHRVNLNNKSKINASFYKMCCFYLNPFHFVFALKKRLPMYKRNPFYS